MEANSLEMVLTYITAFASTTIGSLILSFGIKGAVALFTKIKLAKYSKLSQQDKEEIADIILKKQSSKLTLNADAMVDRATNSRISAIEISQAEIVKALGTTQEIVKAMGSCVADFKTISASSKSNLLEALGKENIAIEQVKVAEDPKVEIEEVKEESKVSY